MRGLLTENLGLKIFSLVMGVVIFLAVRNEQEVTSTLPVQLSLRERADLINTADTPGEILVRVSGSPTAISTIATDPQRSLEMDLAGLSRGVSTLRVREDQLGLPPDVKVISISPSVITVRLEPREKRKLPIAALLRGEPGRGFEVGEPRVAPPEAEVEGPRREVRETDTLRTAAIDVEGATQTVRVEVPVDPPGQHSRLTEPVKATVIVPIVPVAMDRVLQLAVDVPGEKGPVAVKATVRGPQSLVEALVESELKARALPDPERPRGPLPVAVDNLPAGVSVVGNPTVQRSHVRPRG
jgi:YbbR domain-containing protein